jgi:hypothetical protein
MIELATPLSLTSEWHLKSAARLVTIEPASKEQRDRCDVTFVHRDVTDQVMAAAKAGILAHLGDIDAKVASVDLRPRFENLWQLLGKPIRVADGVWLMLNPRRLEIGRVTGRAHVLNIPVSLEARPEIVTATSEPAVVPDPLPPLAKGEPAGGFHILLDGEIDYASATSAIQAALAGRGVTQAGRSVTVRRAALAPAANGRLLLTVSFDGDAKGTLRFLGTPTFDTARKEIAMPDLDYDLATNNPLINTDAWLRSDEMRATFRDRAHFPADAALEKGRELLRAALNRKVGDAMTLNASVQRVTVRGLFVARTGIIVRGEAVGKAAVAVR